METLDASKKMFGHFEKVHKLSGYPALLALWAISETAVEAKDDELLKKCKDRLSLYPDKIEHPKYNFENYRVGGIGKAWLFSQKLFDEEAENIRKYAEITLNSPKDNDGIVCIVSDGVFKTWIDIAACITPFMLYAGLGLHEDKYIDFAAEQTFKLYELFLDKTCGLLHQAKGFYDNPELVSKDHWGRGNGWGYLALTTLVRDLPKNSEHRKKAEKYYKSLSETLIKYQTERGVWRQEIDCDYAWDESSATAFIAFGFGVGIRLGLLDKERFEPAFKRAVSAIATRFINDDFSTNMCCGGCLCPGKDQNKGTVEAYLTEPYPTRDDPHSFGPLIFAMTEAYRNGITVLP